MTIQEKIETMRIMLDLADDSEDILLLPIYLNQARLKIINHRFPFGTTLEEVEAQYEYDQIELAIVYYNQRGGEGQIVHSENGVRREWRTEQQILKGIPRMVGIPN